MASSVTELKTKHVEDEQTAAKEQKVGLTMVFEFAISEGQSLQFSTFAGRDDSAAELNDVLDRITAAGERQRWKADLAKHRRNLIVQFRQIEIARSRIAEAERRHAEEKVGRDTQRDELQREINAIIESDQMLFAGAGKRGEYKPSQQANARLQPLRTMLGRIDPDQAEQDRVRADAIKASNDAIRSYEADIDWTNAEIARCEAALAE